MCNRVHRGFGHRCVFDSSIRTLHAFEAVPYAMAAVLCLRQRKAGYILGVASGIFWLWMAGTLTTFVRNGFERVAMLIQTGHVDRWDHARTPDRRPLPVRRLWQGAVPR